MQIANALEEIFGGRFPEEVLQEIYTVREVAQAIERHMGTEPLVKRDFEMPVKRTTSKPTEEPIPEEYYTFTKMPEYQKLKATMRILEATGVPNPFFSVHEGNTRDTALIDGRELISFSTYNYLGMSGDPVVGAGGQEAIDQYRHQCRRPAAWCPARRTVHRRSGAGHRTLRRGRGRRSPLSAGTRTNETTIGHLFGPGDLILHDALAHNSIVQGAILSGARRRPFPHNDWQAVDEVLSEVRHEYRRVVIAIEGVYSMDGDFPDLPRFVEVKKRHKAFLYVDEAHSTGTLGATGPGITEHFGVDPREIDIAMGTLSKAFGSCGGYIAGLHTNSSNT